jgi:hypothetical protein
MTYVMLTPSDVDSSLWRDMYAGVRPVALVGALQLLARLGFRLKYPATALRILVFSCLHHQLAKTSGAIAAVRREEWMTEYVVRVPGA